MARKKTPTRGRPDVQAHLVVADDYDVDVPYQKKLNRYFLRTEGQPALERLVGLARPLALGGALPYITIRELGTGKDRKERMIVIRHSESDKPKSTGIPAGDMTKEQAQRVPEAQAALASYAEDLLFVLQIKNAPATVRLATAIHRWLEAINPITGDVAVDLERRLAAKAAGNADPEIVFRTNTARAERLIEELLKDRRLAPWNENILDEIRRWLVRETLKKGKTKSTNGQLDGARETTIDGYYGIVRQTRDWLNLTYHPPINMPLVLFNPQTIPSEPLMWKEARLIILWAQGYVWREGVGFEQHWVWENGVLRLKPKKLAEPQLSEHRAEYLPLVRVIVALFLTGSRPAIAIGLGYNELSHRGWVELAGVLSRIHRRGTEGPNYRQKPRKTSALNRLARSFFEVCHAQDLRQAAKDRRDGVENSWPANPAEHYVVHEVHGGPVPDAKTRFKKGCGKLGIRNSIKKLKHAFATTMFLAGFNVDHTADWAGTDDQTVKKHYLRLESEYRGVRRPVPNEETMTFVQLVDPYGVMPPVPRAPAPPRPDAPPVDSWEAPPRG